VTRTIKAHGRDIRVLTAKEAHEALGRFINSHFRNWNVRDEKEHARFSIPTDVNRDDDVLLSAFIDAAADDRERLEALMPLFEEARDALPAITEISARLRGVRLDLADRMDAVGSPERWAARAKADPGGEE